MKEKLENFYNQYNDYIKTICVGGSRGYNNIIKNPHDIDYIFIFKDDFHKLNIEFQQAFTSFKKELIKYGMNNHNVFCDSIISQKDFEITAFNDDLLYMPMYYWGVEIICGDNINKEYHPDILSNKKESLLYLKFLFSRTNKHHIMFNRATKKLYAMYIFMYILKNNSYDLTEEQINTVNFIHDNYKDNPLTEYCEQLEQEIANLEELYKE